MIPVGFIVSRPHVELQYLTLHLTHRGASWASGAAQAAQVVRIMVGLAGGVWAFRAACFCFFVASSSLQDASIIMGAIEGR